MSLVLVLSCSWAWADDVVFDFSSATGISELGITAPALGSGSNLGETKLSKGDVSLSFTDGSTATRIWNTKGSYTLRIYKTGTMTVTSSSNITKMIISGSTALSASAGTLTDSIWTGSATTVTFTASNTNKITRMTVTLSEPTASASSVADLLALNDSDVANLYLSDEVNARVVDVLDDEVFVRDTTGAICLKGFSGLPTAAFNQHVAGYLKGQRFTINGLPVFQPVAETTTQSFLVASPVTEEDVAPLVVSADELSNHPADWVSVSDLDIQSLADESSDYALKVLNKHGLGESDSYYEPYSGSVVDLHAMVYTAGDTVTLVPVGNKVIADTLHTLQYTQEPSYPAERFVLSQERDFVAPQNDLSHAAVRLDIATAADQYQLLTLPIGQLDGCEYFSLSQIKDDVAYFVPAQTVEPGVPYLVKTSDNLSGTTLDSTLLSSTAAQTVTVDNINMVGTYASATLSTDGTTQTVKADGTITEAATTALPLSAWLKVPGATTLTISFSTVTDAITLPQTDSDDSQPVYNVQGQRVDEHFKGIIIKNGKKIINR